MTDLSTVWKPRQQQYRQMVRRVRADLARWRTMGLTPPPFRCGHCGKVTEDPTFEGFEAGLLDQLQERDPDKAGKD